MSLDGSLDGIAVAASQGYGDGTAEMQYGCEDHLVAAAESVHCDRQPAEPVALEGIDAGLVEDKVWAEVENRRQGALKPAQVFDVGRTVVQFDVQLAALLPEGKVLTPVHGKSEHVAVVLKDLSGAVTLMNVEIDDREAGSLPFGAKHFDGDCDVVEDAIA